MTDKNLKIKLLVPVAKEIADAYAQDTGAQISLGQLFEKIVESGLLPETMSAYKGFSRVISKARDEGTFPKLLIQGAAWASRRQVTKAKPTKMLLHEGEIKKTRYQVSAYGRPNLGTPDLQAALRQIEFLVQAKGYTQAHLRVEHFWVEDENLDEYLEGSLKALQEAEQ